MSEIFGILRYPIKEFLITILYQKTVGRPIFQNFFFLKTIKISLSLSLSLSLYVDLYLLVSDPLMQSPTLIESGCSLNIKIVSQVE